MGWRTNHHYDEDRRAADHAVVSTWPRWKRLAWRTRNAALVLAAVAAFAFLFLTVVRARAAEAVHGHAVITDGDTVIVSGRKIRLNGIDAPETDQDCLDRAGNLWTCGLAARDALIAHAGKGEWSCDITGHDRYGRALGTCFVEGQDVNRWMVREGWAVSFTRYAHTYDADQEQANDEEKGLWSGAFIAPWDWRTRNCETIIFGARAVSVEGHKKLCGAPSYAIDPNCPIKANLKSDECIFHVPGGKFYGKLDMQRVDRRWFCTVQEAEAAGCRKSKM